MDEKKFIFQEETAVVLLPNWNEFPYPNPELPEVVSVTHISVELRQIYITAFNLIISFYSLEIIVVIVYIYYGSDDQRGG